MSKKVHKKVQRNHSIRRFNPDKLIPLYPIQDIDIQADAYEDLEYYRHLASEQNIERTAYYNPRDY